MQKTEWFHSDGLLPQSCAPIKLQMITEAVLKKLLISCISGFLFGSTHRCLLVSGLVTCFVSIWDTCLTLTTVAGLVETAPCIDYSVYKQQISRWYQRLRFFFLLNEGVVVFCLLCCFVKKDIKKMFKKNLLKPFRCNSTFSILVKAHFNVPTRQGHNSVYLQLSIRCCGCKYRLTLLHHFIFFDLSLELSLFSLIITTRFI